MAKRIRKHPMSQICRNRPKMGPARTADRTRKPIFIPRLTALEGRTLLATLVVNPTGANGAFSTIQAAVNAAAPRGDTILVDPGIYPELVTIGKSLTLQGNGTGAIIQIPNNFPPESDVVLLEINNHATVDMNNMTVRGPAPGITPDSHIFITSGILVDGGATANIGNSTIAEIRNDPLSGLNSIAVQIGSSTGGAGTATIANDVVTNYQKLGIVVRGGSFASITGNTIKGSGPTPAIGPNGIQISPGATAVITGNTISGNQYIGDGSGPDPVNDIQSAAILDFTNSIEIAGNTIVNNDIGIYSTNFGTQAAGTTISGNEIEGSFEGIYIDQGNTTVSNNTITGNNIGVFAGAFSGNTFDSQGDLVSNNNTDNGNGGLSFPGGGIVQLDDTSVSTHGVGILPTDSGGTPTASVTASFNRIVDNAVGLNNETTTPAAATLNWWGSNTGPNTTDNDTTSGSVNTGPWLVLSIAASPGTIGPGGLTSSVTASVTTDSNGVTHPTAHFFPDGIPITFGATGGRSPHPLFPPSRAWRRRPSPQPRQAPGLPRRPSTTRPSPSRRRPTLR
jgi:parallel beta-helix repeat protein